LEQGLVFFPGDDVLSVFLAMAKYNNYDYDEAMQTLIALTLKLDGTKEYARAIAYYMDKLDRTWS
jgi:hypothetical protein